MLRRQVLALLLAAGCSRSTAAPTPPAESATSQHAQQASASASSSPAASAAPVATFTPDGGLPPFRFGSGHSASGPGHYSVEYGALQEGPGAAAVAKADFAGCYKASPLHAAFGAVLLHVHVSVDATGGAKWSARAFDGTLVDQGGGRQAWEFAAEPSTKDAALVACAEAAMKTVSFPEAARGTTFDVGVKLSP